MEGMSIGEGNKEAFYCKRTISCPLTEERNDAIDHESVNGGSIAEKRTVIPPALVCPFKF